MSSLFSPLGKVSLTSSIMAAFLILVCGFGVHFVADLPVLGWLFKYLNPLCLYDMAADGNTRKCDADKAYGVVLVTYGAIFGGILVTDLAMLFPMSSLIIAAIISLLVMMILRQYFPKTSEQRAVFYSLFAGAFTVPLVILGYKAFKANSKSSKKSARRTNIPTSRFTRGETEDDEGEVQTDF